MAGSGQNPEPQGLAAKIFRNKELAPDFEPGSVLVFPSRLGFLSRISPSLLFPYPQKGCSSQRIGFLLWKAVEKKRGSVSSQNRAGEA